MIVERLTPKEHYDVDPVGLSQQLGGAGLLSYMTFDQLHPPMIDDEAIWKDGRRWYEGAVKHTLRAAESCALRPGATVLDVGCGVGGPARLLVDYFDVSVHCTSISRSQLKTCREINSSSPKWSSRITTRLHDCRRSFPINKVDCVWSMNMLYHVREKERFLANARDALRPGGKLMIDDWMLTPRGTDADRRILENHFISPHFAVREELIEQVNQAGLRIERFFELGHVGRTHLARHFEEQFATHFGRRIVAANPVHGATMVQQFRQAILQTIELYVGERLTYCVLLASKD